MQAAKISEEGVEFKSHLDGSRHFFSPEESIRIQKNIGADIIMSFDECTPDEGRGYVKNSMERTHRWLVRCVEEWRRGQNVECGMPNDELDVLSKIPRAVGLPPFSRGSKNQALFGIIQGGNYKDLRLESAKFVSDQDLPGIAIGGVSVGFHMDQTVEHIGWVKEVIDNSKPFYAMGAGRDPQDIIDLVLAGADMFDCVAPTRMARNGVVYSGKLNHESGIMNHELGRRERFKTVPYKSPVFESEFKNGRLQIGNERWKKDDRPIMESCDCAICKAGYSRAYLRHLYKSKELLYYRLASIHNVRFMIRLCENLREWIVG